MTRMKSRLVAIVAAAGLAIAGAAPAAALSEREQNALSIILGAAALGLLLKEANKDDKHASRRDDDWRKHGRGWNGYGYRTIPIQCSFPIRSSQGPRNVVSQRCLNQFGIYRDLPRYCAFDVRIGRESRRVYGANCLKNAGFRITRYR